MLKRKAKKKGKKKKHGQSILLQDRGLSCVCFFFLSCVVCCLLICSFLLFVYFILHLFTCLKCFAFGPLARDIFFCFFTFFNSWVSGSRNLLVFFCLFAFFLRGGGGGVIGSKCVSRFLLLGCWLQNFTLGLLAPYLTKPQLRMDRFRV